MFADTVILAVGQESDFSWIKPEDGLRVTPRGSLEVDPITMATSKRGVFVGGDAAFGPRIAIEAIADGRRAAAGIHAFLRSRELASGPKTVVLKTLRRFRREPDYEAIPRQRPTILPLERRVGIAEIESCLDEAHARLEASRCFRCWINTEFHQDPARGSECILCGGCADVCPEACIELVSTADLSVDESLREELIAEFGENGEAFLQPDRPGTAIIKDETICIRCGLCALRCPAGTITMQEYRIEESADV